MPAKNTLGFDSFFYAYFSWQAMLTWPAARAQENLRPGAGAGVSGHTLPQPTYQQYHESRRRRAWPAEALPEESHATQALRAIGFRRCRQYHAHDCPAAPSLADTFTASRRRRRFHADCFLPRHFRFSRCCAPLFLHIRASSGKCHFRRSAYFAVMD